MKQTGEVYQPKSAKGNARKREICVLGDVVAGRFGPTKDPSPTPPHKGRGIAYKYCVC
ncbi:hypothetical protein GGD57_002977 [Rhizobium esperanzae]|uniref:Uncharacterized protein n=1 Tax=Rhizobium esperanzae TaxID=1967781 RepID=A0A7W6W5A8_9HYPH|nr:hypothetical protein [Rhizobium esperanzae]